MRKGVLGAASVALVAAAWALPAAAQTAPEPDGQSLTLSCFACHGPAGKSKGGIPAIAGKPTTYIQSMMTEFKTDKRPATVMNRLSKGYSEAEIAAIAKYLATVK
ncbi:MAG: cytochrome c [Alphaproteobacteria bacterium]